MEKEEILQHFDAIKRTFKHQFPTGKWQQSENENILEIFEVTMPGETRSERMTIYHTGNTSCQGSKTNGQNLRNFLEGLSTHDLIGDEEPLFTPGSRLDILERERLACYDSLLPNAVLLLTKAILEDLWKDAFGDTGFDETRMVQAAEGRMSKKEVSKYLQLRGHGNVASHADVWVAGMEPAIQVQPTYNELVAKLISLRK